MILRQKFSLDYMVPLAIDKLQTDILAFGDNSTEGAIMEAILRIPSDFWKSNKAYWKAIDNLLNNNVTGCNFNRDKFDI